MELITLEKQKEYLHKMDRLMEKIDRYHKSEIYQFEGLSIKSEEFDMIERALACHYSVISLDVKKREAKNGGDR